MDTVKYHVWHYDDAVIGSSTLSMTDRMIVFKVVSSVIAQRILYVDHYDQLAHQRVVMYIQQAQRTTR